jgi:hypothetical protein
MHLSHMKRVVGGIDAMMDAVVFRRDNLKELEA